MDAEEREDWGMETCYIRPKGIDMGSEEYDSWFMDAEEGKSFVYSANATANPNRYDIDAHIANEAVNRRVDEAGEET